MNWDIFVDINYMDHKFREGQVCVAVLFQKLISSRAMVVSIQNSNRGVMIYLHIITNPEVLVLTNRTQSNVLLSV